MIIAKFASEVIPQPRGWVKKQQIEMNFQVLKHDKVKIYNVKVVAGVKF